MTNTDLAVLDYVRLNYKVSINVDNIHITKEKIIQLCISMRIVHA